MRKAKIFLLRYLSHESHSTRLLLQQKFFETFQHYLKDGTEELSTQANGHPFANACQAVDVGKGESSLSDVEFDHLHGRSSHLLQEACHISTGGGGLLPSQPRCVGRECLCHDIDEVSKQLRDPGKEKYVH